MTPRSAPGVILGFALVALAVIVATRLVLPGSSSGPARGGAAARVAGTTPAACDDAGFLQVERAHPAGYTEVTICGPVTRVLPPRRTRSGAHVYFLVQVDSSGDAVKVVTNVDETGPFTVRAGQYALVHGRFYYDDPRSQGIDWTHQSGPNASWPYPGYIQLDGGPLIE